MRNSENLDRKIVLEDGTEIYGAGFGCRDSRVAELVFNTSMVGYQEILSDPSYTDQAVVMTYPLIGNYGMAEADYETLRPTLGAFVVREYNPHPSNFRSTKTLEAVMIACGIVGVSQVDTRMLTRKIRDKGSQRVYITDKDVPLEACLNTLAQTPVPHDAVSRVTTREIRQVVPREEKYHVVAVDCGMKENIVRSLVKRGCRVTIVPWNTSAETVRSLSPDGVFLSNGPGDPQDATPVISLVQALRGSVPIFGICLGHQILSLAYGAKTYKLKFGHRGGNHPGDREGGNHISEPLLRRGQRQSGRHPPGNYPCESAGRYGGGGMLPEGRGIFRPVPPGKRPGTGGQRLPV